MRDRVVDSTVRIAFNTNDGDGAPVAPSSAFVAADFVIYKDGSATQKTTTNGITVTSPFDSLVGLHLIEIDTSNDTDDAGFWALNSEYRVAINSAKTVDGVSQSGVIVGEFRLVSGAVELDSAAINAVADQVWDEAMSGHTTAGTYGGRIVRATNSNTEVQITGSNHIAADVHEFQSGVITADDFAANSLTASALASDAVTEIQNGLASQASVNTLTSYVDTEIAAIKAKTDNLPSDPADQSLVEAAITAATTGLSTLTSAQVNAEVLDVLSVDTFAELAAPPAATSSLKDKITWLFMWLRNKGTATATQRKLYADDTTTVVSTETITDDGTTFTKGKAS